MKRSLLLLSLILSFYLAKSQNWTKISGIADGGRVIDLAKINDKIIISSFVYGSPEIGTFFISDNGGNNWSETTPLPFSNGPGFMDALPINNIFTTFFTAGLGDQSLQLTGNTWSNFSNRGKFVEFSNGQILAGSFYLDSVYYVSSSGVLGSAINSSKLSFGNDGKYFVGANNRLFLFQNNDAGFINSGEFHYIDYSDLSSFKIPLTLDGNTMTNDNWRDDIAVSGMIMMDNGDLIASSGKNFKCMKSTDNGVNWTTITTDIGPSKDIYKNTLGHIYGLFTFGQIVLSTDGGVTFNNINGNLDNNAGTNYAFKSLFVNSLNEVFVILNNAQSSDSFPPNSGIYKLDGSTSISTLNDVSSFEIFPNPTTGIFTFKSSSTSDVAVSIFNLMGSTIFNFTTQDLKSTIDLSNQAAGVYFLQATVNGRTQTQKLIVQ